MLISFVVRRKLIFRARKHADFPRTHCTDSHSQLKRDYKLAKRSTRRALVRSAFVNLGKWLTDIEDRVNSVSLLAFPTSAVCVRFASQDYHSCAMNSRSRDEPEHDARAQGPPPLPPSPAEGFRRCSILKLNLPIASERGLGFPRRSRRKNARWARWCYRLHLCHQVNNR